MGLFSRFIFIILVILPLPAGAAVYGYLAEIPLDKPVENTVKETSRDGRYEYLAHSDILIINFTDPYYAPYRMNFFDLRVTSREINREVKGVPSVWRFYSRQNSYMDESGTSALHDRTVTLPDCSFGNICSVSGVFSVKFTHKPSGRSPDIYFSLNGQDVTGLFYYNYNDGLFELKDYYQNHFLELFKKGQNFLSWHSPGDMAFSGEVAILPALRKIKGKLITRSGKPAEALAGQRMKFIHAGNSTVIPHEIYVEIDEEGEYISPPLADYNYKVVPEALPADSLRLASLDQEESFMVLSLVHTVPDFDRVAEAPAPAGYYPGRLFVTSPRDWQPPLDGRISSFRQIDGDNMEAALKGAYAVLYLPETRVDERPPVFLATVGDTRVLVKLAHPVSLDSGYKQYEIFESPGKYAYTAISGLQQGSVLPFGGHSMPAAFINTPSRIRSRDARMHYYNLTTGRTSDITDLFIWSDTRQSLIGDEMKRSHLLSVMDAETGILAATFCEELNPHACYRIKSDLRPGTVDLYIKTKGMPESVMAGKKTVLRELHVKEKALVTSCLLDTYGACTFTDLPSGIYSLELADTTMKYEGALVVEITRSHINARSKLPCELQVKERKETVMPGIYSGSGAGPVLSPYPPVQLYPYDYKVINIPDFAPDKTGPIQKVMVAGRMPGEYQVYRNNSIALFTEDIDISADVTLLIEVSDTIYQLPLHYNSGEYPVVTEKGLDYTMCPQERPLCVNAFVQLKGVSQGIYNGKQALEITVPIEFEPEGVRLTMGSQTDMTDIFEIDAPSRRIVLKKNYIPAFLSTLSSTEHPVTLSIGKTVYYIDITAGYKSLEASVVDEYGAQTPLFSGLEVRASCEYAAERYYSQIAPVKGVGMVTFENLPDCVYDLEIIDRQQQLTGHMEGLVLARGSNKVRTLFHVSCNGADSVLMENCRAVLPVIMDNRMIAPDFGMLLTERIVPGKVDKISITPSNSGVLYGQERGALVLFAPESRHNRIQLQVTAQGKVTPVEIRIDNITSQTFRVLARPAGSTIQPLSVSGVNSSYTYTGMYPLIFKMSSRFKYGAEEVEIEFEGADEPEIAHLFHWDERNATLTLDDAYRQQFINTLEHRQKRLILTFGKASENKHYRISVVLGAGAGDINGTATDLEGNIPALMNSKAILIGRRDRNGNEYRQVAEVDSSGEFHLSNVPLGIYDLLVFDLSSSLYGGREISVDLRLSDIYVDVPVKSVR